MGSVGCGGGPTRQPPPPTPGVAHQSGGALVSACSAAQIQVLARATRVELWRLPTDTPPTLLADLPLGQPLGPAVDHLTCDTVTTIGRGALRWRIDLSQSLLIAAGPGAPTMPALPLDLPLESNRIARIEPARFGVTGPKGDEAWRAVSGPLAAALWDGAVVWAVGVNGLWRWRPGPGRPITVPLPGDWRGRALAGVFRDGPYLWVRDGAGTGAALDISTPTPTLVGEPGPLPIATTDRHIVAGRRQIEARLGESRFIIDGRPHDLEASLDAITEYRDGLLIAAGGQLRFWGDDPVREVWRTATPGRTVGIFALTDGRVILVGRRYGFMALTFGPQ
ncbi:MAG: hypothetical protein ACI9U2_004077 [Bradymonadia bacterium]|jgi:hypothetical protein